MIEHYLADYLTTPMPEVVVWLFLFVTAASSAVLVFVIPLSLVLTRSLTGFSRSWLERRDDIAALASLERLAQRQKDEKPALKETVRWVLGWLSVCLIAFLITLITAIVLPIISDGKPILGRTPRQIVFAVAEYSMVTMGALYFIREFFSIWRYERQNTPTARDADRGRQKGPTS